MHRGDYLSHGAGFIPTGQGWVYPWSDPARFVLRRKSTEDLRFSGSEGKIEFARVTRFASVLAAPLL
jgi:hypothetical protein